MLTTDQINDLHRLYWSERWPIRKIERHLRMGWRTIKKYLDAPAQGPAQRQCDSKLDPFKPTTAEWLEKDPTVTAAVIEQKLRPLGYKGGHSPHPPLSGGKLASYRSILDQPLHQGVVIPSVLR